jgi:hypothetical protein
VQPTPRQKPSSRTSLIDEPQTEAGADLGRQGGPPQTEARILLEDQERSYHAALRVSEGDQFDHRLIFADNLLASKALEQEFARKIKSIFIDPPYNTASDPADCRRLREATPAPGRRLNAAWALVRRTAKSGPWTSIAAAAGNSVRGCRAFHLRPAQPASRRTTSRAPFRYTVRHTSSSFGSRTSHQRLFVCLTMV